MLKHRDLFEIKRGNTRFGVAVQTYRRQRMYIGSIDGQVCATAAAKGDLLRTLMEMASSRPRG